MLSGQKVDTKDALYAIYIDANGKVIGFEDMTKTPIREIDPIVTESDGCGSAEDIAGSIIVPLSAIACPPGYRIRCIGGVCRCVRA